MGVGSRQTKSMLREFHYKSSMTIEGSREHAQQSLMITDGFSLTCSPFQADSCIKDSTADIVASSLSEPLTRLLEIATIPKLVQKSMESWTLLQNNFNVSTHSI